MKKKVLLKQLFRNMENVRQPSSYYIQVQYTCGLDWINFHYRNWKSIKLIKIFFFLSIFDFVTHHASQKYWKWRSIHIWNSFTKFSIFVVIIIIIIIIIMLYNLTQIYPMKDTPIIKNNN
jgi:predicted ferric reductase